MSGAILSFGATFDVGTLLVDQGQQRLVLSREVLEVVGEGAVVERGGVAGGRSQQAGRQLRGRPGARRERLVFAFLVALRVNIALTFISIRQTLQDTQGYS